MGTRQSYSEDGIHPLETPISPLLLRAWAAASA
jgi:hypothetical protein